MDSNNLINSFDGLIFDGKGYPEILVFFADLKREAEQKGYSSFEIAINDDGTFDVIGFDPENSIVHPNVIAKIDSLLEPYLT